MRDWQRMVLILALCLSCVAGCSSGRGESAAQAPELSAPGAIEAQSLAMAQPLAYVRAGDVWLLPAAGGEPVRLTSEGRAWHPAVAPDGASVAYVRAPQAESELAELWSMALDTGEARLLLRQAAPWGPPVWSPDGSRLAWPTAEGVALLDAAGVLVQTLAMAPLGMDILPPTWSGDGGLLYQAGQREGAFGVWMLEPGAEPRLAAALDPALPLAMAPAPKSGVTLWSGGELRHLGDEEPMVPVPERVGAPAALAWSENGERLALLDASGALWISEAGSIAEKPILTASGLAGLQWIGEGALALWRDDPSPRDQALLRLDLAAGQVAPLNTVALVAASALSAAMPQASSARGAQAAYRPYDYYRYQGSSESGAMASSNCGPASLAMAIQFARDNQRVPIRDIRAYIGGSSWTYASSLTAALTHWGVASSRLHSLAEVDAALARGSLVLAHVWMVYISPGADYMRAYTDPAVNTDRYYAYGQSHWLVLKGTSADGQWVIAHDPNVWDGNGVYWYSGNTAKGRDRLYRYSELAAAIAAYNYELIEVPGSGEATRPTEPPVPTASATPTGGLWYTVRAGDTLYRIAQSHGTTVAALVAANSLADPNRIYIGQQLWIPQPGTAAPTATATRTATSIPASPTARVPTATVAAPTATPPRVPTATPPAGGGLTHTVALGETLGGIATRYGVTVQAIVAANNLANPNLIRVGQRLWIPLAGGMPTPRPTPTATPAVGRWHVVQRGETLSTIALEYGTSWQAIAQANGLSAWSVIYPGQRLRIP